MGILVDKIGSDAGDQEIIDVGRIWVSWGESLYIYPTFEQNYVWTRDKRESSETNEEISFLDRDGLQIHGDFGVTFIIEKDKILTLFEQYRNVTSEIVDGPLRNKVRDALNDEASKMTADQIVAKKTELIGQVEKTVRKEMKPYGIDIKKVNLIGAFRLPPQVQKAIEAKIEATQIAIKRENELRKEEANAKIALTKARADSAKIAMNAQAEAEANRLRQQSLTPMLIQQKWLEKWNGEMPAHLGTGNMQFYRNMGN